MPRASAAPTRVILPRLLLALGLGSFTRALLLCHLLGALASASATRAVHHLLIHMYSEGLRWSLLWGTVWLLPGAVMGWPASLVTFAGTGWLAGLPPGLGAWVLLPGAGHVLLVAQFGWRERRQGDAPGLWEFGAPPERRYVYGSGRPVEGTGSISSSNSMGKGEHCEGIETELISPTVTRTQRTALVRMPADLAALFYDLTRACVPSGVWVYVAYAAYAYRAVFTVGPGLCEPGLVWLVVAVAGLLAINTRLLGHWHQVSVLGYVE